MTSIGFGELLFVPKVVGMFDVPFTANKLLSNIISFGTYFPQDQLYFLTHTRILVSYLIIARPFSYRTAYS